MPNFENGQKATTSDALLVVAAHPSPLQHADGVCCASACDADKPSARLSSPVGLDGVLSRFGWARRRLDGVICGLLGCASSPACAGSAVRVLARACGRGRGVSGSIACGESGGLWWSCEGRGQRIFVW